MSITAGEPWRPTATFEILQLRARLLAEIRAFFAERSVLEVETPILARYGVSDPNLHSLVVPHPSEGGALYLQTSPEFAMKRLLCAGSGPIYQIAKAFRDEERGRLHNLEFTLVEWYRPGLDPAALMLEVEALIRRLLGSRPCERMSYGKAFEHHTGIDPHRADVRMLRRCAERLGIDLMMPDNGAEDVWLDLFLSHCVAPHLGRRRPCFLYDFPQSQAALAALRKDAGGSVVADRFELYIEGIEIANGCRELGDPAEQRHRFEADRKRRRARGLPPMAIDERLIEALGHGLPDCSGVALGFDRLVMVAARLESIEAALAFASA